MGGRASVDKPGQGGVTLTRRGLPVVTLISTDLYESLMETLDILSDPQAMKQLRKSLRETAPGRLHDWESVKKQARD